jgi:hypothetical protein
MKTRRLNSNGGDGPTEIAQSKSEAADFHSRRLSREQKISSKKISSTKPTGDDEYEQLVAEEADFNTCEIIAEAAYFLAEKRGFSPGEDVADWLQAEIDVERMLRSPTFDRRSRSIQDRREASRSAQ